MNSGHFSLQQRLVLALVCFVVAVRVFSGPLFIAAAVEHAEIYSGVCLAADPHCFVNAHHQVQLEDEPSNTLNLYFHLIGSPAAALASHLQFPQLPHALHAHSLSLLLQPRPNTIFHPPRASALSLPRLSLF